MTLGELIKKHRLTKGLAIAELAKEAGISRPYLSQIEGGTKNPPSEKILRKLAVVLDISPATLLSIANKELFSEEYVQETLDYNELYLKINSLHNLIVSIVNDKPDLIERYNFLIVIDQDIKDLRISLSELASRRIPHKYPLEVENHIVDYLSLDAKGRNFINEQLRLYKNLFLSNV